MGNKLEVKHWPSDDGGTPTIGVILKTSEGKPYTAITARAEGGRPDSTIIGIHRSTGRKGTGVDKCEALGGAHCRCDSWNRPTFPEDPEEQVRALIEKLQRLHPSMTPKKI